jgi:hypothetical protein
MRRGRVYETAANGAATITGNSRQNLGNLGCVGVVVVGVEGVVPRSLCILCLWHFARRRTAG